MKINFLIQKLAIVTCFAVTSLTVLAQQTSYAPAAEDVVQAYQRANKLDTALRNIPTNNDIVPIWKKDGSAFWYKKNLPHRNWEYIYIDVASGNRKVAFNAEKLAQNLGAICGKKQSAKRLQLTEIYFANQNILKLKSQNKWYQINLKHYSIIPATSIFRYNSKKPLQQKRSRWERSRTLRQSPDGKSEIEIRGGNLILIDVASKAETPLSKDGTADKPYGNFEWSPDGKALIAYKIDPKETKKVYYVLSSVPGTTRGELKSRRYAQPSNDFEYLFIRDDDKSDAKWMRSADFIDFSVKPENNYQYTVKVKDNFGNVTVPSLPVIARTDSSLFNIKRQSGVAESIPATDNGLLGTFWDDLMGTADTVIQQASMLKMISHNTLWDGSATTGPFAYKNVEGDFVAEVTLSDLLGLAHKKAYGASEAGIMVKLPNDRGKLIQNGVMPSWGVGNIVTDLGDRGRKQSNNLSGWSFYTHLQIQRVGDAFFMRGSHDGKNWMNLPGSPVKREDLATGTLEVGVYHATYGDIAGYAAFKDFKVIQKK